MPDLSIVIPVYNQAENLQQALTLLARQEAPKEAFEVVVIDDGSQDDAAEIARMFARDIQVRYEWRPNQGRAAARNRGVAIAESPALLFMDADMQPTPAFLAAHLRHHRTPGWVGVQGRVRQHPDTLTTTFMRATNLLPDLTIRPRQGLSPLQVITRNFSVTAEAFRAVGGFDERFTGYGWEDMDLGMRLTKAGVELRYEPQALALHYHVQELDGLLGKLGEAGEGAVYFWDKHGRPARLGLFLEIHPALMPLKRLVYRTGVITRMVRAVLPWAERRGILPLCSECYNHLLWRAFYEGVDRARRNGPR